MGLTDLPKDLICFLHDSILVNFEVNAIQVYQVYSTLKQRGNNRFNVVSAWNTRGVFVGRF